MTASMRALRTESAAPALERAQIAPLLRAVQVTKSYRGRSALHALDLTLEPGESLFLLGPNGAGKTTLLHLCAGVLVPDAGEIYVSGTPPERPRARNALGFVPQALALYPRLTARENLAFFARVHAVPRAELRDRVEHGLTLAGLVARADSLAGSLSLGMQRRLHFACGVLHRPRLLLLDEPTVGVDPEARAQLHAAIEAELRAGVAVVCATHLFDEAERLADRVLVLRHGRVCADGAPAALRAEYGARDLQAMVLQLTGIEDGR